MALQQSIKPVIAPHPHKLTTRQPGARASVRETKANGPAQMDDQELPSGPSDRDKLRDRIFQQRLWIEELRRTADKKVVGRAIADLEYMTAQVQKIEERRSKRSLK